MRRFAGTGIALAIFAAMLAYLLIGKPKTKDERTEAALTVADAKRDKIDRIEVENANGKFSFAKEGDDPLRITSPIAFPLEDSTGNQMLNALSSLVASEKVFDEPTADDIAKAGLSPPAATVNYRAEGVEKTLLIGGPFANGENVYVAAGPAAPVFLVRKFSVDAFQKSLNDYRRKKLFDFERDGVVSLTFEGAKHLAIDRVDPTAPWRAAPGSVFDGRADRGKINGAITKLSNARAERFLDATDPEAVAFTRESAVSFRTGDGKSGLLQIGAATKADPAKWLARIGTAGQIVLAVGPKPLEVREYAAWRDPSLYDFALDDVRTIDLRVGKETIAAERSGDENWKTTQPSTRPANDEINAFLKLAKIAKSVEYGKPAPEGSAEAKRYGFDAPALRASWVTPQEKMELVVGLAKPGTDSRWIRTAESPLAQLVHDNFLLQALTIRTLTTNTNGDVHSGTHHSP